MNLRTFVRVATLAGVLLVCLAGHTAARFTGGTLPWVRRFLARAASILGADVTVSGRPLPANVLYIANHLSWFDILAMGGATGTAFVSKDAVRRWPVIGRLASIGGTIFIARTSRAEARAQADALARALATGRPATLFPEGTTGDGIRLLPFHGALLAAAASADAKVQPVAIDYGAHAEEIAWKVDESAMAVAIRLIGRRGRIPICLHFLDPIEPATLDRKAIATRAQAAIAACLGQQTPPIAQPLTPPPAIAYSARP